MFYISSFQVAGFQARRFALVMWGATPDTLHKLARLESWECAEWFVDDECGACEMYLRYARSDKVNSNTLETRLVEAGFSSITMLTFPSDNNKSAAACVSRIRTKAYTPNHSYFKLGDHDQSLERQVARLDGVLEQPQTDEPFEFDVVKKRLRMEAASELYESSPDALARFEDFERHTLPALLAVHANDLAHRAREMEEFEDDVFSGKTLSEGGVYFARSAAIQALKIGATRRGEPAVRLRELSRCVPVPFELVAWVPTDRPFKLERIVHTYFAEKRILTCGACTEFFSIDDATVAAYARTLIPASPME